MQTQTPKENHHSSK